MGQAKRRRAASSFSSPEELNRGLIELHNEGRGLWKIWVIPPRDMPLLIESAARGNRMSRALLSACGETLNWLKRATPPGLCLLCDYEFTRSPAALAIMHAHIDDPSQRIASGLCPKCFDKPGLMDRIVAKYRDGFGVPDLRVLPEPSAPGHA